MFAHLCDLTNSLDNDVDVGCGEPNLHLDKHADGEGSPRESVAPSQAGLEIHPIDASAVNKKFADHTYISQHLSKRTTATGRFFDFLTTHTDQLWGLKAIQWGKGMHKYIDGVPDRFAYVFKHPVYDADGRQMHESMVLTNPLNMSDVDANIWFEHILASEQEKVPKEEALTFIGRGDKRFSVYGSRTNEDRVAQDPVADGPWGKKRKKGIDGDSNKKKRGHKRRKVIETSESEPEAVTSDAESDGSIVFLTTDDDDSFESPSVTGTRRSSASSNPSPPSQRNREPKKAAKAHGLRNAQNTSLLRSSRTCNSKNGPRHLFPSPKDDTDLDTEYEIYVLPSPEPPKLSTQHQLKGKGTTGQNTRERPATVASPRHKRHGTAAGQFPVGDSSIGRQYHTRHGGRSK